MRWFAASSIIFVLVPHSFAADAYTPAQKRDVIQDVWAAFDAKFYDSRMRGVDWAAVREEIIGRTATSDLEPLIFEMIGRLKNSHSGYLPPSDRPVFFHFLPFAFERVSGRVFVTVPGKGTGLKYGDEILTVDGQPGAALRPPARNYLAPRRGNPYYGFKDSTAAVELAGGRKITLPRVRTL